MKDINRFKCDGSKKIDLKDFKENFTGDFKDKSEEEMILKENNIIMNEEQGKLYALGKYSVLLIFQGMDASGKDGAIRRVMSGLNPQGTQVWSFKQPSLEETKHDYLWRVERRLPERGQIGIFNRSYYEEVLVTKVHDLVKTSKIPKAQLSDVWDKRYEQIKNYEKYLYQNGTVIVKFFMNLSKDEQRKRLLERINDKSKNWKFSESDIKEREFWDDYRKCYQDAINNTSTHFAPWYIIPADKKWYARIVISEIIIDTLKKLELNYPSLDVGQNKVLEHYKSVLEE